MDWPQIVGGGLVGIMATALLATWRFFFIEMRRDRDFWRDMALGTLGVSEKATDVAEAAVKHGTA